MINKILLWGLLVIAVVSGPAFGGTGVTLLAIMPVDTCFVAAIEGIKSDLGSGYTIIDIDAYKAPAAADMVLQCKKENVKGLILMDSKAVSLAGEMQSLDSSIKDLPKFVLMTLKAEEISSTLRNVAGIRYEVPGFTLVSIFHRISQRNFKRVGLFYRKEFEASVNETKRFLAREKITLFTKCIDENHTKPITPKNAVSVMKKLFKDMIKKDTTEVILTVLDNGIINKVSLENFWLNSVRQKKMPVVAPLSTLADPPLAAAVFAADPDYFQLGVQAANQITQIFEDGKSVSELGFEPTISVITTLNLNLAIKLGWELKPGKLNKIDRIINSTSVR